MIFKSPIPTHINMRRTYRKIIKKRENMRLKVFEISLILVSSGAFLMACAGIERAKLKRDADEYARLKPVLLTGSKEAEIKLNAYLKNYRDRSVGDPFAEVEESPYRLEAIETFQASKHRVGLDQRWFEAWDNLWTYGPKIAERNFQAILTDYKDAPRGNVYKDALKKVLRELKAERWPAQWSPTGVMWVGVPISTYPAVYSTKGKHAADQAHKIPKDIPPKLASEQDRDTGKETLLCMTQNEITVAQYRACVDAGVCPKPGEGGKCAWDIPGREQEPINCVKWEHAAIYSSWVGGRLPTRAEWVYIAHAGPQATPYPWGKESMRCVHGALTGREESCSRGVEMICRRGAGRSKQGICDLIGNVSEWLSCSESDSFGSTPEDRTTDIQMSLDMNDKARHERAATCSEQGRRHIGGSWRSSVYSLKIEDVSKVPDHYSYYDLGFRPVRRCRDWSHEHTPIKD